MRPRQVALARHHSYRLFSHLFLEGLTPALLPYVRAVPELEQELPDQPDYEAIAADHFRLLGMELPPYESVFLAADGLLGGTVSEAVAVLFRQFGLPLDTAASSPDHIGHELAALAYLCHREATTSGDDAKTNGDAARRQQGRLLEEHLLRWLVPFHVALGRQGDAFYVALSRLCLELVRQHFASVMEAGLSPAVVETGITPTAHDLLEDDTTSLREIADFLLVPCRSGIYLSRADIGTLGRHLQLPRGFGDRRQTLLNLMRTAAQYDQFRALIRSISGAVAEALLEQQRLREGMPELAGFIASWEAKLSWTHGLLSRLEASAGQIEAQAD